jgi:hypothetical protein
VIENREKKKRKRQRDGKKLLITSQLFISEYRYFLIPPDQRRLVLSNDPILG